jgi:ribosomal protein S18 acetylase RimI-like enzyme
LTEVRWLASVDEASRDDVVRLVTAVMAGGGAVGWLDVPSRAETLAWLDDVLGGVAAGRARLAAVLVDGRISGLGRWVRYDKPTVAMNADLQQLMIHPDTRGRGLARILTGALVDDAREHGIETLTLDVRGNNPAAMALYESFGFAARGRLPDFVGVGDERWDRVIYALDLRTADAPLRRHGAAPIGPGASALR